MSNTEAENATSDDVSLEQKLDEFEALVEKIDIAMLTTRGRDGSLVSRPMDTQPRTPTAPLWFMASKDSHKIDDIENDSEVNLAYYDPGSREWVSVSGTAVLSQDRARIHAVYQKDWKAWFEDLGGNMDGGPDDPRIMLIDVVPHEITYLKVNEPKPLVLFKVAKAMVSGGTPDVGSLRHIP